jgi:hypothetical protein
MFIDTEYIQAKSTLGEDEHFFIGLLSLRFSNHIRIPETVADELQLGSDRRRTQH